MCEDITVTPFQDLQAKAKAGGCFIVHKGGEYLLYRQMPSGVANVLVGKRKHFDDMASLVGRTTRSVNKAFAEVAEPQSATNY